MDAALQPEGVQRAPLWKFLLWLGAFGAVLLWGAYAAFLCWYKGLNQTNMNDAYGFALWIWADLAVIALGGGAFFTGFLRYIAGKKPLANIINYAVLIGFICYSSALLILGIDVGQPLRGWFIFWHANVHSMLTEVAFCLSCYFAVLCIEYLPLVLENRQLDRVPFIHNLSHNFHETMAVFAATGAFLSFFHQGSLGGVSGVLYSRPFGIREGVFIWPWTFFLFTWSAAAYGPSFTLMLTKITEGITRKKLVSDQVVDLLAKISGWMILTYLIAKVADTVYWALVTAPEKGFAFMDFYNGEGTAYGLWILVLELIIGGLIPAVILVIPKLRQNKALLIVAVVLAVVGVSINRWVMILQMLAVPLYPFESWYQYFPSWQEVATTILPVAYGVLLISLSHRYLPVFPQERELNPA
ncbi:MAG: polysulfide reductase NrfD [Deltaproteobacteria bacterium]|nr:polysulfide reductase NrfD [Deltaproteobacteria bacterium]